MKICEFYIGIDFGHGETSVSRMPGTNGEIVSRIPLRRSGDFSHQKVISAICKDKDGKWKFFESEKDYKSSDIREGFKNKIDDIKPKDKEALKEFAKLIFNAILENDPELEYDSITGDANFKICIANPSKWRIDDNKSPEKYLEFFRDEAGIKPISMCINESDAAFYTMYHKYSPKDNILVIDLGSSTVDFTTYHNSKCIPACCWGLELGAHKIESLIMEYGYDVAENKDENLKNTAIVDTLREKEGKCSVQSPISLAVRKVKERFFTEELEDYYIELQNFRLLVGWPDRQTNTFKLFVEKDEFYNVIGDYISELKEGFKSAKERLNNYGIEPSCLLLSGGASRMPFVLEITKEIFPQVAKIYLDDHPEWVVSDGAARYLQFEHDVQQSMEEFLKELNKWFEDNFMKHLADSINTTLKKVVSEVMYEKLYREYISLPNNDVGTLFSNLKLILMDFIPQLCDIPQFKDWEYSNLKKEIESFVHPKVKSLIKAKYGKDIEVQGLIKDDIIKKIVDNQYLNEMTINNCPEAIEAVLHNEFVSKFESLLNIGVNWDCYRPQKDRENAVKAIIDAYSMWEYSEEEEDKILAKELQNSISQNCKELISQNRLFLITHKEEGEN